MRTGRANATILSDITVDYYGVATPITQVAAVKTPEAHMLMIEPWDKALLNAIVKAISSSDLGITPNSDGSVVRLPFPAPPRSVVVNSSKSAAKWPSKLALPCAMSAATQTINLSATKSFLKTMFVANRLRIQKLTDEYVAKSKKS